MTDRYLLLFRLSIAVCLLLVLRLDGRYAVDAAEVPVLTSIQQVRKLGLLEAGERPPVRIQGIVTFCQPKWNSLFLHDGQHSVFVHIPESESVEVGQRVEVTGTADVGATTAGVRALELKVLGDAELPEPLVISDGAKLNRDWLVQWVELEGVIYTVATDEQHCFFGLARGGFGVYAILPVNERLLPLEDNRGRRVLLRGMLVQNNLDEPDRIDLLVPDQGVLDVSNGRLTAEPPDSPTTVRSIVPPTIVPLAMVDWDQRSEFDLRVCGVVSFVSANRRLFISDESRSLPIELPDHAAEALPAISAGDVVLVDGHVTRGTRAARVNADRVAVIGSAYPGRPRTVTATSATQHVGQLVTVDGTLRRRNSVSRTLSMQDGDVTFRIEYPVSLASQVDRWDIDSRFRVTGGCLIAEAPDSSFTIDAQELTVLAGLPLEVDAGSRSVSSTEAALRPAVREAEDSESVRWLMWSAVVAALLLSVGGATGIALGRKRLREQRDFQNRIHGQLGELAHVARLNLLSEMVGALAHELNQPLTSVTNYAMAAEVRCQREHPEAAQLHQLLDQIGKEAFRAAEIIRRLRNLVQRKTPGREAIHIGKVVTESAELFRAQQVTSACTMALDIEPDLPIVYGDEVQLQQVVLNLLMNAADATQNLSDSRLPDIRVSVFLEDNRVVVSVKDNGTGISSNDTDSIFDPYFTTKDTGTGLGLAISRTIIETHGGAIRAERIVPYGTRISFSLPLATSGAQASHAVQTPNQESSSSAETA